MSLLDICQRVLAETGWPVLGSIAANNDGTARQIFAIANTELRSLSEEHNWPQLEVEYDFATVAAQTVYLWPADFRVMAHDAIFDTTEYYRLRGSLGLPYWQLLKYGNLASLSRTAYRTVYPLGVPGIEVTPAPVGIRPLVGVYYSSLFAVDQSGENIPQYSVDTDTSRIPERLIELGVKWRFRRAKGLDFSAELAEYNATVRTQLSKFLAMGEIPVGGPRVYDTGLTPGYVRDNGFGA